MEQRQLEEYIETYGQSMTISIFTHACASGCLRFVSENIIKLLFNILFFLFIWLRCPLMVNASLCGNLSFFCLRSKEKECFSKTRQTPLTKLM